MSNRIAIVGSRAYPSEAVVRAFVRALPPGSVVVSGGAPGVDSWAVREARARGLAVDVRPIRQARIAHFKAQGLDSYRAYTEAAYERNREIVDCCDRLYAFRVGDPTKGGTTYTARYAEGKGKLARVWDWPEVPEEGRP